MQLVFVLTFVACAFADVSELSYNYQQPAPALVPVNSYLPPAPVVLVEQPHNTYIPQPPPVAVEQPYNSYIPPPPNNAYIPPAPVEQPSDTYIPPAVAASAYIPPAVEFGVAEDGYRYKTVRRRVHKNRA